MLNPHSNKPTTREDPWDPPSVPSARHERESDPHRSPAGAKLAASSDGQGTDQGMSFVGQVRADLMPPARVQQDLHAARSTEGGGAQTCEPCGVKLCPFESFGGAKDHQSGKRVGIQRWKTLTGPVEVQWGLKRGTGKKGGSRKEDTDLRDSVKGLGRTQYEHEFFWVYLG